MFKTHQVGNLFYAILEPFSHRCQTYKSVPGEEGIKAEFPPLDNIVNYIWLPRTYPGLLDTSLTHKSNALNCSFECIEL